MKHKICRKCGWGKGVASEILYLKENIEFILICNVILNFIRG
jgi:hypothetical protein